MGRGRRLRRGSEPTRTTNLDGIFTLNECADYIAEDKWPTIPDAVSDLGLAEGDGALDLSWSAPSSKGLPFSLYSIEYIPSGGNAVTITTNNTSYQLTGLTNDTEYSVRVGAIIGDRVNYGAAVTGTPVSGPVWATIAPLNSATFCGGSCGTHVSGSGTEADPYTLQNSDSAWFYRWRGWVLAETSGTIRVSLPDSNHYLFAFSSVSALGAQTAEPGFGLVDSLKLARGGGTFDVQVQAGQPLNIVSANYEKGGFDEWRPPSAAAAIWSY